MRNPFLPDPEVRHRRLIVLAWLPVAVLAGCGGSSNGPSSSASAAAQASLQSLQALSSLSEINLALGDMEHAPALEYSFTGIDRFGPTSFTVTTDGKGDLTGTLTTQGQSGAVLLANGVFYVQGTNLTNLMPVPQVPAGVPPSGWIELHQTGGNGFFDSLANPAMLEACIHAGGVGNLGNPSPTTVMGQPAVTITNTVDNTNPEAQTGGAYTITATAKPIITKWTITSELGTQDQSCPGGPQTGPSANLLIGTLTVSEPASPPVITAPPVAFNEPQDDQYTYLPTPQS